jgi:hypothetical protein
VGLVLREDSRAHSRKRQGQKGAGAARPCNPAVALDTPEAHALGSFGRKTIPDTHRGLFGLRLVSLALAAVAAAAFVLGIAVRLSGGHLILNLAPLTLWRFSIACLGFAIYLHLYAREGRR